ncbi:MAG: radical SAM protein [Candidatus Omnitrophota bacterium]
MSKFKVLFIYPNTMMATLIPLGLTQLAGVLKEKGIDTRLFDTTFYKTEDKSFEERRVELLQIKPFDLSEAGIHYKENDIVDDLRQVVNVYKPDLIGVTFVEDTVDLGLKLLKGISDFNIPVVAGGVHVTLYPDEMLKHEDIDIICVGEGEGAMAQLCSKLKSNDDIKNIKNIWVKDNVQVYKNSMRPLVDINKNPILDFSIWEKKRLLRPMYGKNYTMLHVEVERGCPFQCTYCGAPALRKLYQKEGYSNYYRRKDYQRVIEEIECYTSQFKVDYIYFNAESFLSFPEKEFVKFADTYRSRIGLPFWCQSRVENVTGGKLSLLKAMGCASMQFGIESGNEDLRRKVLLRNHSNERIVNALCAVERHGIAYTVNNIIGFPKETRKDIFDTIFINRKINPRTINCFMFTPYKGTELYDYCIQEGHLDKSAKTKQSLDGCLMKNTVLSKEELKGLQRVFPLYCRFPESRFDEIRAAEKFSKEGNDIFKSLSREYQDKYFN